MGGIVEGGIGTKSSPRRAAIDKAQAELRLEYDIREERRRELEFLEKGGNPLDFKFGIGCPLSGRSSSVADQLDDQFGNCEAKGGFSSAASPLGDSIGSSGRLGATIACEPNGADNFDGENEIIETEGKRRYASRSNNTHSEHSSQLGGSHNVRDSEDSPIFHPKKAYRRRNRSKTNRDSARLIVTDIGSRGGPNTSFSDRHRVVSDAVVHVSTSEAEMDASAAADPANDGLSQGKDMSSSKHLHKDPTNLNVKDDGVSTAMASMEPGPCMGREQIVSTVGEYLARSEANTYKNGDGPEQQREPDPLKVDGKITQNEGLSSSLALTLKGLNSDTSCIQTIGNVDENGNSDSRLCTMKNRDSIGEQMESKVVLEVTEINEAEKILKYREMGDIAEINSCRNDSQLAQSCQANGFPDRDVEEIERNQLHAQCEAKHIPCSEDVKPNQHTESIVGLPQDSVDESIHKVDIHCPKKQQEPHSPSIHQLPKADVSCSASVPELQPFDSQTKVADKAHEDQILEKARDIMAKHKIIEDMSLGSLPKDYCRKTQWDFVLEEMAWMANDFAQERVWKRTAATQLCYRTAFASRLRFGERDKRERDKVVAQTLAKDVINFWQSAALLVGVNGNGSGSETFEYGTATSENIDGNSNSEVANGGHTKEYVTKNIKLALQGYAVRFLQLNSSVIPIIKETTPRTPEGASVISTDEMTCQNQQAEEDLFYVVPHGAMEDYRKSIERHLVQCLRAGKMMQEEVNTSMYNLVGEYECQENGYEEDEGENVFYLPGAFEGSKASKFAHKKRKNPKSYTPRSYEVGDDFSYGHGIKNRISIPQTTVKRPANGLNNGCPIPTKRVRTASRQRVVGPFSSGAAGFMSYPSRTDASSGDTNSCQDDQSTLQGGPLFPKGLEVQSGMDYDKQSAFDCAEITAKPKKKKSKHQGMTFEQRWQVDCNMQIEQRNRFKKRLESHQIDSNSNNDSFAPHAKKPKLMKQSLENSYENTMSGSAASPMGSQMSNMSNSNKLIKLIGGRDRGRKTKSLKIPSVQNGSGSPWSLFEDQALVVLVHDMGPNWELVSDAINSTLHFKCIFRKPQECKDRHAILLEKSWGDGADTEDSGSSQPYPSTLPGIPKGGARQLFQQLHGPVEEDTIKSHFEKIILIGQQLHGRKKQEAKQLATVHSSHLVALSQMIPSNVNGGILTPLDLCDMASSSPDVFSGSYQGGVHNGSLPLPNQAAGQPMLPTNSSLQGPPGSSLASSSAQVNVPVRDGRYGIPRASLPIDEQQRIQQYNNLVSSRNIQQPNMSVPGGNAMSMPRAGLQGISGSMAASNMAGAPSTLNVQPGASVSQGISIQRPRDALMMRVSQANSRGVPSVNGLSSTLPSQTASLSGPYPVNQQHLMQQQHSNSLSNSHHPHLQASPRSGSTEQRPFNMSHARDRQLQQRMLQRQQQQHHHQQFPTQSQLPISTSLQKSSQIQSQASSQQSPLTPSSPIPTVSSQQQKHQLPRHGRTALTGVGGKMNQVAKQRQHQPQQQAKVLKGTGSVNTLVRQHHPVNAIHLNGLSSNSGSQLEKGHIFPRQSPIPAGPPPSIMSSSNQQLKVHQHPPVKLVNQRLPNIHRAVLQNPATNSDPLSDPQNDLSQAEQQLENSTPMSPNTVPTSETQLGPIDSPSMSNSSGNEPRVPGAHGIAPKQPPNSFASSLVIQRKQLQQSQTTLPSQVLIQQKHQPLLHQHPQPHAETAPSNTLTRTSNTTLE